MSSLQTLTNLIGLDLGTNQISDISPLQYLTNLANLFLFSNQITDTTPLQTMTNLTWIYIRNNPLTQYQIDELQQALPYADIVWLWQ